MSTEREVIAIQDCQDGSELIIKIGSATVLKNGDIIFQLPYPFPTRFMFKIVDAERQTKEGYING